MPTVCIDWDDTLVGYKKFGEPGEWLPDACAALRFFKKHGWTVVIHSCRASWPEGLAEIRAKLLTIGVRESARVKIHTEPGKPLAMAYIDDRGLRYEENWRFIMDAWGVWFP